LPPATFSRVSGSSSKAEAEAYLDELQDFELDPETLKKVAGGNLICNSEQGEPLY
jgi:hypothetical protein